MTAGEEFVDLRNDDCLNALHTIPDCHVDAVVTDPPYGLEFMGREWDKFGNGFQEFSRQWAAECLRVLKPGGYLLAFGGTRTSHRLVCGIEDAGLDIRDSITWLYGSGFPKSLDVSKAIDKAAGAEREVVGSKRVTRILDPETLRQDNYVVGVAATGGDIPVTAPATDDARRWQGWGTALKPASEPIVVARKPLSGTVAQTVLAYGTGALNIDGCRVDSRPRTTHADGNRQGTAPQPMSWGESTAHAVAGAAGRWPANVVLSHAATPDGADLCGDGCIPGCPVAELDAQSGVTASAARVPTGRDTRGIPNGDTPVTRFADTIERGHSDSGGASRFFPTFRYQAKAPSKERPRVDGVAHPTVKPLALMRWLVRLVCAPGGLVLEPFAGSGTTVEACLLEDVRCIAIERDSTYLPLIQQRIRRVPADARLF